MSGRRGMTMMVRVIGGAMRLVLVAAVLATPACRGEPRPVEIVLHEEICTHCRMAVSQREFAGEVVTAGGAVHFADDIGCLVSWAARNQPADGDGLFVVDFATGEWLDARSAVYLESDGLPTPMSSGLAAFGDRVAAETRRDELSGELRSWNELIAEAEK